jgi:hypothetical protein
MEVKMSRRRVIYAQKNGNPKTRIVVDGLEKPAEKPVEKERIACPKCDRDFKMKAHLARHEKGCEG